MTTIVCDILPSNRGAIYELISDSSMRFDAVPKKIEAIREALRWFDALIDLRKRSNEDAAKFVKGECQRVMSAIPALTESVDAITKHVEYCKSLQRAYGDGFTQLLYKHTNERTVSDEKITFHIMIAIEQMRHVGTFNGELTAQLSNAMWEVLLVCKGVSASSMDITSLRAMVGQRNSSVDCDIITGISKLLLLPISDPTREVLMRLLEYEAEQFIGTYSDLDAYKDTRNLVGRFIHERIECEELLQALLTMPVTFTTSADTVENAISACMRNFYQMLYKTNSVFLTLFTLANVALFLFKIEPVVWCAEEIPFEKTLSTVANWAFKCYLAYVDRYELDDKYRKRVVGIFRAAFIRGKLSKVKFHSLFINPHLEPFGKFYSDDVGRVLGKQLTPHECCFYVARAIAIETNDEFLDWALALEASVSPASVDANGLRKYSELQGLIPIDKTQEAANIFHKIFQQNKNYANLLAVQS